MHDACPSRPAAVAAGRADLPLPAALRVLLQPDRLRAAGGRALAPTTGCACCARAANWAPCSSACRAASRWCATTSKTIVAEARRLGYYTNLLTSGVGLTRRARRGAEGRRPGPRAAVVPGLDASEMNDFLSHTKTFELKSRVARDHQGPGLADGDERGDPPHEHRPHRPHHRHGGRDRRRVPGAREHAVLLVGLPEPRPAAADARAAAAGRGASTDAWRARLGDRMRIFFVAPDYHEGTRQAVRQRLGQHAPDRRARRHRAALPHREDAAGPRASRTCASTSLREIWFDSEGFNRYRGTGWMKEPCSSCEHRERGPGRLPLPGLHAGARPGRRRPGVREEPASRAGAGGGCARCEHAGAGGMRRAPAGVSRAGQLATAQPDACSPLNRPCLLLQTQDLELLRHGLEGSGPGRHLHQRLGVLVEQPDARIDQHARALVADGALEVGIGQHPVADADEQQAAT